MANIYINNRIKLSIKGLRVKDESNKLVELHCRQGRLDGACAVYSTVMALLTLGYISEDDISTYGRLDRRTPKGKMLSRLFEEQGLVRDGYNYTTLTRELRYYCGDLEVIHHIKTEGIENIVKCYVQGDKPVLLMVNGSEMCHAILAVGVECEGEGENEVLSKIFCLDPGFDIPLTSYWNCIIEVEYKKTGMIQFKYVTNDRYYNQNITLGDIIAIDYR